jgi:hypothetical protein
MALNVDFNALKARTMGSGADEEAVTVDTRGLISKVLARYSGKWLVSLSPQCHRKMLTEC